MTRLYSTALLAAGLLLGSCGVTAEAGVAGTPVETYGAASLGALVKKFCM